MSTQDLNCDQIVSHKSTDNTKRRSVRFLTDGKVSNRDTLSDSIVTAHATRNTTNLPTKTFAQEGRELLEARGRRESSISDRTTLSWD